MKLLQPPLCCIGGSVDDARTNDEVVDCVQSELDLINEGQDGTEEYTRREVTGIRRWLRRHQPAVN